MPKHAFSVLYTTQVKRHPRNRVWNDGFLVLDDNRTGKLVTEAGNALTEWCQLRKTWLPVTAGTEGLDCFDGFLVNCDAECRPRDVPGEGGWEESPAPEPRPPEPAAPTLPQRHPRRPARSRALHLQPRKRPAPVPEPEPPRRGQPPAPPHGRPAVLRGADLPTWVESPATSASEGDEEMARELSCVAHWFGAAAAGEPQQPSGAQHAQHATAQRDGSWQAGTAAQRDGSWQTADAPLPYEKEPRHSEAPGPDGTGWWSGAVQPGEGLRDGSREAVQQTGAYPRAHAGSVPQQQQEGSCHELPNEVRPATGGLASVHALGPALRSSSQEERASDLLGTVSGHAALVVESREGGGQGGLRTKWGVADAGWGAPPSAKPGPVQTVTAVDDAFDLGI